jgi:hypothetical protein
MRTLKSIDLAKVDADTAVNIKMSIYAIDRLAKTFEKARTDADLQSAMRSAVMILDALDQDDAALKVAH